MTTGASGSSGSGVSEASVFEKLHMLYKALTLDIEPEVEWDDDFDADLNFSLPSDIDPLDAVPD